MNSLKIFKYELKRLIGSKVYLSIAAIVLMYSYYLLSNDLFKPLSPVAPFSKWSYSGFLCQVNFLLLLVIMFFATSLFDKKEKKVREITASTPMSTSKYFLIKSLSIAVAYLLLAICVILESFIFYYRIFKFTDFQNFLQPMLIIMLPSFLLVFGLSLYLGSRRNLFIYIMIPIVAILSAVSVTSSPFLDIFANGYINAQPLLVAVDSTGEPLFILSLQFILSRMLFALIGLATYIYSFRAYILNKRN